MLARHKTCKVQSDRETLFPGNRHKRCDEVFFFHCARPKHLPVLKERFVINGRDFR